MTLTGDVINASIEERELTGKDGAKRKSKISHVLLMAGKGETTEIINIRAYDADWPLPAIGTKGWITPRIRRYENFDGQVADVSV